MSAIENPRPLSRRTMLTGLTVAVSTTSAIVAPVLAASADPIFALAAAERRAWEALDESCAVLSRAEDAFWSSPWSRQPRVLVGHYTQIADPEDDWRQIPQEEWVAVPTYFYSREEIDAEAGASLSCADNHDRAFKNPPGTRVAEVEARRLRRYRELEEDEAAIAASPEAVALDRADALQDEALAANSAARDALFAAMPTTPAGLLVMLEAFERQGLEYVPRNIRGNVVGLFAAVRSIIGGRA